MSATVAGAQPKHKVPRQPYPSRELTPVLAPVRHHAPRAPFVVTVLLLLMAGLGSLLLLNTLLAQGAFTVHDLDIKVAALEDQEQALQQKVAALAAPGRLAHRANAIGMVPAPNPAFIRMSDGRILGEPQEAPQQYTVPVTPPPIPSQNEQVAPEKQGRASDAQQSDQTQSSEQSEESNHSQQPNQSSQPEGDAGGQGQETREPSNGESGAGRDKND